MLERYSQDTEFWELSTCNMDETKGTGCISAGVVVGGSNCSLSAPNGQVSEIQTCTQAAAREISTGQVKKFFTAKATEHKHRLHEDSAVKPPFTGTVKT